MVANRIETESEETAMTVQLTVSNTRIILHSLVKRIK